jgi:MraZ protein
VTARSQSSTPTEPPAATPAPAADAPFFIGQFPLTVDDKGRFLIPSDIRKELDEGRDGKGLILITGPNGKYWLYPERFYKEQIAPKLREAVPDPTSIEYTLLLFSEAARLVPDKAGRVLLPETAVDRDQLGRDVILIGQREHLQLWRRDEWTEYLRQKKPQLAEIAQRFKAKQTA